jgi:Trk-type K+ transport system membrane component
VVDTATFFTFKGQFVIMMLIVVGGINIISFGSFIALASKVGVTIKHHSVIEGFVNKASMFSAKSMLGRVLLWIFTIELLASLLIYFSWTDNVPFKNLGDKIFCSIFHAISAFNNAGFSIFTDGLYNIAVRDNSALQIVIAFVIFFGSLGILTLIDLFSFSNILDRIRNPWKQWQFGTKIAFYFSVALVLIGAFLFFILETNNTLYDKSLFDSLVHSFFQSVATRTAGFNTLDLTYVGIPTLFIMIFLMFIGASSGSTGGGIKTSTFALIFAAVVSSIRDDKNVSLFKRTVSNELILRAFSVLLFFISGILVSTLLLCITETNILLNPRFGFFALFFEVVSSYSTVGLSMGITSELSSAGKIIITLSMFIGRVGALTIAFAVGKRVISNKYKYPQGYTMVG